VEVELHQFELLPAETNATMTTSCPTVELNS